MAGPTGGAMAAPEEAVVTAAGAMGEAGPGTQQWRQASQPVLDSMGYQELGTFSGMEEPGHGEGSSESWLEQASHTLHLWRHVSERERRRRLVESLRGPALDLLRGLLAEDPELAAQDCLAALVQVFGNKDPRGSARLKFVTCAQRPQETLSAYVMRLEGLLQSALEKGAIHPAMADQARARQVLMRARLNDTLRDTLRRRRLMRRPPGFAEMLRLIQKTEAWDADPASREHFPGQEEARVDVGVLAAAAQAAPAHEAITAGTTAHGTKASPAGEDSTAQAARSKEGRAEDHPAREEASAAVAGTAQAGEAAPEDHGATRAAPEDHGAARAAPGPGETSKASTATQEDGSAAAPAGLGQAGPSDAPGVPMPGRMGSASPVAPGGPGWEPEGLAQAGGQEAEETPEEGLKPIPEEPGNEDGAAEMSPPGSTSGQ
ncbi:paraneoplastic antigen Ma6F-like [Pseudorca crassidens]|uniref:paraneoplastic antigen Ma6F-like n=1 Tax=Pseudorca crassidens TaxID=82174 RepID=UPI00352D0B80